MQYKNKTRLYMQQLHSLCFISTDLFVKNIYHYIFIALVVHTDSSKPRSQSGRKGVVFIVTAASYCLSFAFKSSEIFWKQKSSLSWNLYASNPWHCFFNSELVAAYVIFSFTPTLQNEVRIYTKR